MLNIIYKNGNMHPCAVCRQYISKIFRTCKNHFPSDETNYCNKHKQLNYWLKQFPEDSEYYNCVMKILEDKLMAE